MFDEGDLFEFLEKEIDESRTSRNVKSVLKHYNRIKSMVSFGGDPSVSDMSINGYIRGSGGHSDRVADEAIKREQASRGLKEMERALNTIDEEYLNVLKFHYTKHRDATVMDFYLDRNMSESTYYRYLKLGEVQFAEAYKAGILLVFKD